MIIQLSIICAKFFLVTVKTFRRTNVLSYRVNKFRATFFPLSEYVTFTSYDHTYRK